MSGVCPMKIIVQFAMNKQFHTAKLYNINKKFKTSLLLFCEYAIVLTEHK